jgi:hypothetical protein
MVSIDIGVWFAAILTIFVLSFFATKRPNIFFKIAETTIIGISLGYVIIAVLITNINSIGILKIRGGEPYYIISLLIGLLIYARFLPKGKFLAKYPLAIMMGVGLGVGARGTLETNLFRQLAATTGLLVITNDAFKNFNNLLFVLLLSTTIYYFYFTREQKGVLKGIHQFGRYALMIYFGSAFGNTVLSRLTMLIARFQFLIYDWLRIA